MRITNQIIFCFYKSSNSPNGVHEHQRVRVIFYCLKILKALVRKPLSCFNTRQLIIMRWRQIVRFFPQVSLWKTFEIL